MNTVGGAPVGCGVLKRFQPTLSLRSNDISIYPGYGGPLKPSGSVEDSF